MTDTNDPDAPNLIGPPIDHSPKAIARVTQSHLAELLSWTTLQDLPTFAHDSETAIDALNRARRRDELGTAATDLAVLNARLAGLGWETIARRLAMSAQAAVAQYDKPVRATRDQLLLHWLRGRDRRDRPAYLSGHRVDSRARRLDQFVAELPTFLISDRSELPDRPVSGVLRPPDHAEHGALLIDAANGLRDREHELAPHDDQLRPLRVGYARRLVQFWLAALADLEPVSDPAADLRGCLVTAQEYQLTVDAGDAPDPTLYTLHANQIRRHLKEGTDPK